MTRRTKESSNKVQLSALEDEIISGIREGRPFLGKEGTLTPLIKKALEAVLSGEVESHISDSKAAGSQNRRNGVTRKLVQSSTGTFELATPRDRAGSFEPEIVKKRQTVLTEEVDSKILSLFSQGMSYSDIRSHLEEIYGIEVSPATISKVTDQLLPLIDEWRSQPLESVYPILFLDAIHFKVRQDGRVVSKALYSLLGIDCNGCKQVLGLYLSESEGANFWCQVLADLKERGVEDILIACIDGLKGFPDAIASIFPKAEIQLCIVHQIRNSLRYVASKDQKAFLKDLKEVYRASSKDLAETNLLKLEETWGRKYPLVIKSWQENWEQLSSYFKYDQQVRKLIYTTNPVEGFHRQLRKYTKSKGAFTSENALKKLVYCAIQKLADKWTQPIQNWALMASQLDIHFPDRMTLTIKA